MKRPTPDADLATFLVYSDYLQSRDDPRGELIGIDCKLEPRQKDPRYARTFEDDDLEMRRAELLKDPRIHPEVPDRQASLTWRRGFVSSVLLSNNEALSKEALRAFFSHESLALVTSLRVENRVLDLVAEVLDELTLAAQIRRVEVFPIDDRHVSGHALSRFGRLEKLILDKGLDLPALTLPHTERLEIRIFQDFLPIDGALAGLADLRADALRELALFVESTRSADEIAHLLESGSTLAPRLERLELGYFEGLDVLLRELLARCALRPLQELALVPTLATTEVLVEYAAALDGVVIRASRGSHCSFCYYLARALRLVFRRPVDALTVLEVVEIEPKIPERGWRVARIEKGNALAELGREDEALVAFDQSFLGMNDDLTALAWNNIGVIHARRGERDAAVKAFANAASLVPLAGTCLALLTREGDPILDPTLFRLEPGPVEDWYEYGW